MVAALLTVFTVFLLLVLTPHEALAWGPGVHTATARFVLANLDLLVPATAALLARFPKTYLYGCLCADFFVGKGAKPRPNHSHNWESAAKLLRAAGSEELMAHALGYVSHLAADVIAHNYYVPQIMARAAFPGKLAHVYAEMQADSRLTGGHVLKARSKPHHQHMLDKNLALTLGTNPFATQCRKRVFRSGVRLAGLRNWDRSLRAAQRLMPLPDAQAPLDALFELSLRATLDALRSPHDTILHAFDPIGSHSLVLANRRRMAVPLDERLLNLPLLPTLTLLDVA